MIGGFYLLELWRWCVWSEGSKFRQKSLIYIREECLFWVLSENKISFGNFLWQLIKLIKISPSIFGKFEILTY